MSGKQKATGNYTYNTDDVLGSGAWGTVYKGYSKHHTTKIYAIKKMNKFKIQSSQNNLQRYKSEVISLQKSKKIPEVIKIVDFFKSKSSYYIITQYQEGTIDLYNYLKENPTKFSELQAKTIWIDLLHGIRDMHDIGITHRDLKLQNLIYHPGKRKTKIIDFGLATTLYAFEAKVGSPLFMSPQVIKGQKYTYRCDIWSLGIVFYWMVCHTSPYGENPSINHIVQVMSEIDKCENLPIPKGAWMSKNCEQLIKGCLKQKEQDRLTINEILKMKFFKEPNFSLIYTRWLQYYEPQLSFAN